MSTKQQEKKITQQPVKQSLAQTLEERGNRYGPFSGHASITWDIKRAMIGLGNCDTNWSALNDSQREALEMIAHKVGRILNGDPNYADSWVDIAGYAQLIVDQLEGKDT